MVWYSYEIDNYGVLTLYKHTEEGIYSICDIPDCNNMDTDSLDYLLDELIREHEQG